MAEDVGHSPKLILKHQGSIVKECVVTKPEFTIGRKPDNDLVIEDAAVSGHHAKIVQVQSVFFIEDLKSTNGTFVNGHKFDRKQLQDADVVTFGKHRLVFLEEGKSAPATAPPAYEESDKTVFLKSGVHGSPTGAGRQVGMLQVVSGRTDRTEYRLTKQVTIIGSQPDAVVKLTGFFAPKTAAVIGRRSEGYYVTVTGESKKVHLNNLVVEGQADLKDGDLLEVAGVKMYFYVKAAA